MAWVRCARMTFLSEWQTKNDKKKQHRQQRHSFSFVHIVVYPQDIVHHVYKIVGNGSTIRSRFDRVAGHACPLRTGVG
jgi:hypothetical protein